MTDAPGRNRFDRRDYCYVLALLLCALPLYAWNLRAPFVHHWESHGALYSLQAANFLKFGTGPIEVPGPTLDAYLPSDRPTFVRHPPLPQLILAAAFGVFGESEATFRALLLCFSFACSLALLRLLRFDFDRPVCWTATALYTFMPLVAYYSTVNGQLAIVMLFVFAELLAYRSYFDDSRPRWVAAMAAAQILACCADWQGYYAAPVIAVHAFWTRRRWGIGLLLLGIVLACFAGFVGYVQAVGGLHSLLGAGAQRFGEGVGIAAQLRSQAREAAVHATLAVVVAALIGFGFSWRRRSEGGTRLLFCTLLLGLDQLLFRAYVVEHDFLLFPLAAPVATLAAIGVVEVSRSPRLPRRVGTGILAVLGAAFALQSFAVLRNRLTDIGANGVRHQLAVAVREVTAPNDRVLVITRPPLSHLGFYARRYVEVYDLEPQTVAKTDYGPREGPISPDDLLDQIRSGKRRFQWAVVPDESEFLRDFPPAGSFSPGARREWLSWWYAQPAEGTLARRLGSLSSEFHVVRGFRFIRLRP